MRKRNPPPTASGVGATKNCFTKKCSQDWSKLNCLSLFRMFAPEAHNWTLSKKVSIFKAKMKIFSQFRHRRPQGGGCLLRIKPIPFDTVFINIHINYLVPQKCRTLSTVQTTVNVAPHSPTHPIRFCIPLTSATLRVGFVCPRPSWPSWFRPNVNIRPA